MGIRGVTGGLGCPSRVWNLENPGLSPVPGASKLARLREGRPITIRRLIVAAGALIPATSGCSQEGGGDGETEPGGSAACDDPEPLTHPVTGDLTGFVRCSDGFIHREQAIPVARPEAGAMSTCETGSSSDACLTAADCIVGSPGDIPVIA